MIDAANNNMNEKIWDNTLTLLESSVSKPIFDTWMKHTSLALYSGEHIIIKVRNDFENTCWKISSSMLSKTAWNPY